MNIRHTLNNEFCRITANMPSITESDIEKYTIIAKGYAEIENVVSVLSNLKKNESFVFHSKFSNLLDINTEKCNGHIPSIWEDEIFKAIHPDDLETKLINELLFVNHINKMPDNIRYNQCLVQHLRMLNKSGKWMSVMHRLFYIPYSDKKTQFLTLCLYGATVEHTTGHAIVIDTLTGQYSILDNSVKNKILSKQETAVIKLINRGYRSRDIADQLNISIHTVSRHRQNIIAKLNVHNSAEACKTARNLGIL